MTTFLILLAVLVLADAASLVKNLRSDRTRRPPSVPQRLGHPGAADDAVRHPLTPSLSAGWPSLLGC